MLAGAVIIFVGEGFTSKPTPTDCGTDGLSYSLDVVRSHFQFLAMWVPPLGHSQHGISFLRVSRGEARERASKTGVTTFPNLILEMLFHHFHHLICTRSRSLDPAHSHNGGNETWVLTPGGGDHWKLFWKLSYNIK